MVEEGIESHHRAKLKAVDRLGIPDAKRRLPRDEAVDLARREYLRLFGADASQRHLENLRALALEIMGQLEAYSPLLVGSVADGTAGRHSPILIHAFPDTSEQLIKTLIDLHIPYREGNHLAPRGTDRSAVLPAVSLHHCRATIDILMFPRESPERGVARRKGAAAQIDCRELRLLLYREGAAKTSGLR